MIEQVDTPVRFFAFYSALKLGKTGLAVTVRVWRPDGDLIIDDEPGVEVGGGLYQFDLAGEHVTQIGEYPAVFSTAEPTVDSKDIPALWTVGRAHIENLLRLTGGVVDIRAPVVDLGRRLDLVAGDDYLAADGRALRFTGGPWPGVDPGDPVTLTIFDGHDAVVLTDTSTLSLDGTEAAFELTSEQTAALPTRDGMRFIVFADSGPSRITIHAGSVRVIHGVV